MSPIHLYPSLNYNSSTMKIGYRVPYHSYSSVETTVLMIMLSSLSIIGSIGNTLVIIVFWSKHESLVSTFYILVLSVVDLITCLFIIPLTIVMELWSFETCDLLCKVYQFLITSSIPFSAMIMVAIAFDRYFAICHPLSRMGKNAGIISRISVGLLACIALSFGIIIFLMYGTNIYLAIDYEETIKQNFQTLEKYDNSTASETSTENNKTDLYTDMINNAFNNLLTPGNTDDNSNSSTFGAGSQHREAIVMYYSQQDQPSNITVSGSFCTVNFMLFTDNSVRKVQIIYIGLFVVCFIIVGILYILLFLSVIHRRKLKSRRKKTTENIMGKLTVIRTVEKMNNEKSVNLVKFRSENATCVVDAVENGLKVDCNHRNSAAELPSVNVGVNDVSRARDLVQSASNKNLNENERNVDDPETTPLVVGDPAKSNIIDVIEVETFNNNNNIIIINNNTTYRINKNNKKALNTKTNQPLNISTKPRRSIHRDRQLIANLKTAMMLFVVTLVFIITYLPAFLQNVEVLPYNVIVYYFYFANNVANPFIYSFMNQKFRDGLAKIFLSRSFAGGNAGICFK